MATLPGVVHPRFGFRCGSDDPLTAPAIYVLHLHQMLSDARHALGFGPVRTWIYAASERFFTGCAVNMSSMRSVSILRMKSRVTTLTKPPKAPGSITE